MNQKALDELDVDRFWERGYAILHDVYTPEEIEQIRQEAYDSRGTGGDLLANPLLRHVITDGRMAAVAAKLLGTDEIYYGGDSSFTINGTQCGWHKDNTDRVDGNAPDWDSRYTQLRFGIYCQDHVTHTGGLNLKIGSHDIKNTTDGETLYVKTQPGDLAVWSMRITHSGNGMLLKDPEAGYPEPLEQKNFSPEEVCPADGDRIAIFAHLGAHDSHAERYGDYLKTRTYMVNAWRKRPYDDDAYAAVAESGLILRDMPKEVMNDPKAGLSELWQPFPYEGWTPPKGKVEAGADPMAAAAPAPAVAVAAAPPAAAPTAAEQAVKAAKGVARKGRKAVGAAVRAWRNG